MKTDIITLENGLKVVFVDTDAFPTLTTILLGSCSNNTTYLIKESCEEIAKIVQEPKIEKDISYIVKEQASKYNINGNIFFEYLVDDEGFIKVKNFLEEKIEGYKNDVEKFKENISEILLRFHKEISEIYLLEFISSFL